MKKYEIKSVIKVVAFCIAVLIVAFFIKFIFYRIPLATKNFLPTLQKSVAQHLPTRIKIPALNIDTVVEHVGNTPEGAMDVPSLPSATAWYNLGPVPGVIGSAVIDGHAGYKNGVPAVFDYLYKLHVGDKIYIQNDVGETATFVIRKKETYQEDANAEKVFKSTDGLAHLNLITCSGPWDKKSKSHPDRLVVFADLEK